MSTRLLLVAVQHLVDDGNGQRERNAGYQEHSERYARDEHHGHPDEGDHQRGPKVRLKHDERNREADKRRRGPDRAPLADVAGGEQFVEAREDQHDPRLHEFAGLQADEAQVDPALGALSDKTDHLDHDQHDRHRRCRSGRRPA